MNTQAAYLIAKYIPDLRRMEPRNIGIVLWAKGRSVCRFLAPSFAEEFVNDRLTYERWISFWTRQVESGVVQLPAGKCVPVASDHFLSTLKLTQKENYALDDGGELVERFSTRHAQAALEFLFDELVATHQPGQVAELHDTLESRATRVLDKSGIASRDDFHRSKEIECNFAGVPQPLRFHYFLGNGKPRAVMQRVKIEHGQSVNSAAWMFERVRGDFRRVRTGAIVDTTDVEVGQPSVTAFMHILQKLTDVVLDVAVEDAAILNARKLTG